MSPKSVDSGDQDRQAFLSDLSTENGTKEEHIENTSEENNLQENEVGDDVFDVPTKMVKVPSSSFLPQALVDGEDESDSEGAFFIEGESEELSAQPFSSLSSPLGASKAEVTCQFEPKSLSASNRPILKAAVEEEIPVCTNKSSWSKLPVPDMNRVRMKRAESLCSFFHLEETESVNSDKSNSKVNFQDITIREYYQTMGDNPAVSYGAPIQLDWDYEEQEPLDLDIYEAYRGKRRNNKEMHLNYIQRKALLKYKFGYSEEEIEEAQRGVSKIHKQRDFSKAMQTKYRPLLKLEEMRESAVRKVVRKVGRTARSSSIDETKKSATMSRSVSNLELNRPILRLDKVSL